MFICKDISVWSSANLVQNKHVTFMLQQWWSEDVSADGLWKSSVWLGFFFCLFWFFFSIMGLNKDTTATNLTLHITDLYTVTLENILLNSHSS